MIRNILVGALSAAAMLSFVPATQAATSPARGAERALDRFLDVNLPNGYVRMDTTECYRNGSARRFSCTFDVMSMDGSGSHEGAATVKRLSSGKFTITGVGVAL